MSWALGSMLGCGLLLCISPWAWPAQPQVGRSGSAPTGTRRLVAELTGRLQAGGLGSVPLPIFAVVSLLMGVAAASAAVAVTQVVALGVVVGLVAAMAPGIAVTLRLRAMRLANRTVWPDVVDHLVSAVRAGLALPDAVATLSDAGPAATRSAFARFESSYRRSGDFATAITDLKEELRDPVADRLLETLRMAREVGGTDVTAVLRSLAGYLRDDAAIRQEAQARQSWIRNAAKLGVAAPWVILLLLATRPEAVGAYNSAAGAVLILVGLVVSVVAYRLMLMIGRLPEERRWFQ